jgi:hypothetical protein
VPTRLGNAQGWVRMDGKPWANTPASVFTSNQVWNPILFDENGQITISATSMWVMTGTKADGTPSANNCADWTNAASSLLVTGGYLASGPAGYGAFNTGCGLSTGLRVICMGTTKTAPVAPTITAGRKIWTSAAIFAPNLVTTPDSVCQAERPSGVTTAAALIAYTGRPGSSVLDPVTSYVRPDGTLVGTGAQMISASVSGLLESGPWQRADGTYDPNLFFTWTGSVDLSTIGTVGSTCNNWTDPSTVTGTIGAPSEVDSLWWDGGANNGCGGMQHLICVQLLP